MALLALVLWDMEQAVTSITTTLILEPQMINVIKLVIGRVEDFTFISSIIKSLGGPLDEATTA